MDSDQIDHKVSFDDIGGLQAEIQLLKELVDFQLLDHDKAQSAKSAGEECDRACFVHVAVKSIIATSKILW